MLFYQSELHTKVRRLQSQAPEKTEALEFFSTSCKKRLKEYIRSLPDTPPTQTYGSANDNRILDWTVTNSRALPEELS